MNNKGNNRPDMAAKEAAQNLMLKPLFYGNNPFPTAKPNHSQYSPTELQQSSKQEYHLDHRDSG
jgi:hypothetical protein